MGISLKKITFRRRKLSNTLQLRFLELIHRFLSNGYTLLEALEAMQWDKEMESTAAVMIASLKEGYSVDQSFEKAAFHPTISSYLYFVRGNGDLQGSVAKCRSMYEHRIKYAKRFQQTSRYPLILFFVFGLLLYFIQQSVLPSFQNLFQTSPGSSATIKLSMFVIETLGFTLTILAAMLVTGIIIFGITKYKFPIERQMKVYRAIPIYSRFLRLQTSYLFAIHFSSLLKTGMSFREILFHMSEQQKLPIVAYYSQQMTIELTKGFHIASLLTVFHFMEPQLTSIFRKDADAHALEKDLSMYAELLMEEIQRKVVKIITLIQPVFFLILASFIIFIYVTLMWPMFQLIKTI
ncbi:type II secretion system F family protein [Oceanobacillus massiliensis]|uniref:type II secretion system F family protein n=1 Tax=Oceanobacillus massiliensis TaxID=1465765 RepID=UPI0030199A54